MIKILSINVKPFIIPLILAANILVDFLTRSNLMSLKSIKLMHVYL